MNRTNLLSLLSLTALFSGPLAFGQTSDGFSADRRSPAITMQDTVVVGAKLGIVDINTLGDTTLSMGAFGDYALADNFLVGGALDYWSERSGAISDQSVEVNDLSVGAEGKFIFTNVRVPFRPYALAGLAAHRFAINYAEADPDAGGVDKFRETDSTVEGKLGADFGGGAMYRVQSEIDVIGEVRWRRILNSVVDLNQLAFTGAVAYHL